MGKAHRLCPILYEREHQVAHEVAHLTIIPADEIDAKIDETTRICYTLICSAVMQPVSVMGLAAGYGECFVAQRPSSATAPK